MKGEDRILRDRRERILRHLEGGEEDLESLSEALGVDLRGMSRAEVAMLYIKLGGDPERVSSVLDWRDFESFVSKALEEAGMEVARGVRIPPPRGFEIDVLGVDVVSGTGLAIDCKHWSRSRGLSEAARQMVERLSRAVNRCEAVARAFAPFSKAQRIYPALVTLKDPGARSVHGVVLIPIHVLEDAIRGLPAYLEELGARAFHNPCFFRLHSQFHSGAAGCP